MSTLELIWILAVVGFAVAWLATRSRSTRRLSWRRAGRAAQQADAAGEGRRFGAALRWLIFGDGLDFKLRWRLAGAQRLIGRIPGRMAGVGLAFPELRPALFELRRAANGVRDSLPLLSAEVAGRLSVLLFLGDCAVISAILMRENNELPLLLALITCLALAVAQFAVGKLLGKSIIDRFGEAAGALFVIALTVIVLLATSLAALLYHVVWAWGFIAVAPAIGAAGLTVISHDEPRHRLFRAKREVRKPRRRSTRAVKRLGQTVGRASAGWTKAATLTARHITALEQAEAAADEVTKVGPHLTETVRGVQLMLIDAQLHKLGELLDEAIAHLRKLEDGLAAMATEAIDSAADVAMDEGFPTGPANSHGAVGAGDVGPNVAVPPATRPFEPSAPVSGAVTNGGSGTSPVDDRRAAPEQNEDEAA